MKKQKKIATGQVLVVNPGSTSTKYKIFNLKGELVSESNFKISEEKKEHLFLVEQSDIQKVVIRVVHGGDISEPSIITKALKRKIADYVDFAPIHNKRALEIINVIEEKYPKTPLYACFDTSFHTTIPEYLSTYAIPTSLAKKHNLRKYGFHGLAVQSALQKLRNIKKAKKEKLPKKIICIHLGGGCSITAVHGGKSLYTSMGLTPISGIMMTTRVGDVDSDLSKILSHREGKNIDEISDILNNDSGFLGLTGSKDTLKIFNNAQLGKKKELLAFNMFVAQITEKVFGYAGLMQGVDAIIFSGGIGYGNKYLRDTVSKKVKMLGINKDDIYPIDIDEEKLMFEITKKYL